MLWALLFLPHLFLGQRVTFGDSSFYRPFAEFSRARWHDSRERTYWNPYVFMGVESVANFADSRPQYLPDALLDVAERLHEPAGSPQLWLLLAHLGGSLAMLALARRLWGADPWSAAVGAVAWLFSVPLLGLFAHGFDAQVVTDTLIPVVLLGTQIVWSARVARGATAGALLLAAALGTQCLHGHPQILVYSSMLAAAFALQQWREHGRPARLAWWVAGVTLGLGIGAAVWLPALLHGNSTSRAGEEGAGIAMAVVAKYSYAWRDLLSLVWAQSVGFGRETYWGGMQIADYSPYLGAVTVALAFGGFRRTPGSAGARFWWWVLGLGAVLSLGAHLGAAFEWLHRTIPFWNRFRAANYVIVWTGVAIALLAARGASRAFAVGATDERASRRAFTALAIVGAAGLVIALTPLRALYMGLALASRRDLTDALAARAAVWAGLELAALAAAIALTLVVLDRARAGRAWARPAVVFLAALDLAVVAGPDLWRSSGPPSLVEPPAPPLLARVAADSSHARVFVGAARPVLEPRLAMGRYTEAYTNFWIPWGVRSLIGNLGAFPGAWLTVMRSELTRSARTLRAWGVCWYDLDRDVAVPPGARVVAEDERARVIRMDGALGRAYAVPVVVALPDRDALLAALAHPDFDPAMAAVTLDAASAGEYPGSAGATLTWRRDDPEHLVIEVIAAARAFVVIADSHAPGWRAAIDGRPAPITAVDLLVRGVALEAGRHVLEMTHETPGVAAGTRATRAALVVWLVWAAALAVLRFRSSRSSERPESRAKDPAD